MANGAGLQGAGVTSAGFGTPSEATEPGGAFLRDTRTGKIFGARKIDPRTRDFVIDSFGRLLGVEYVKHAMQMSLHTEKGSAAVQRMGQMLRAIDRITPNVEQRILLTLTEAVQPLISQGLVEVLGFSHFTAGNNRNGLKPGAVYGRFLWKDLTTGQEHEEIV